MTPVLAAALLALLASGSAASETPDVPTPPVAIGVAPFEGVADSGVVLPDLATLLADRLAAIDAVRVIAPSEWGASAIADPSAEKIRRWAGKAGVETVLVGRTTGIEDDAVRLSVTLFSAATGEPGETRVVEIAEADDTRTAIERLAAAIAEDAASLAASPPPVTPGHSEAGDGASREAAAEAKPFGISIDNRQPLSIRSDELEASQQNGARHLIFHKNVEASQADVTIHTEKLEAFYPPDSKQPARLIATGDVVLVKGKREARCDRATYDRVAQKLICTGHAALRDGEDEVEGEEIEFDLASEAVMVSGGAAVRFHPGSDDVSHGEPGAEALP